MYLFYGIDWSVPDYQLASSTSLNRFETYSVFNLLLKEHQIFLSWLIL